MVLMCGGVAVGGAGAVRPRGGQPDGRCLSGGDDPVEEELCLAPVVQPVRLHCRYVFASVRCWE